MDVLANSLASSCHLQSFAETKRHHKAPELDNGSMADFLTIDDLLDFSNDDIGGPIGEFCNTAGSSTNSQLTSSKSSSPFNSQSASVFELDGPGDLCVPCDDLAELEWLSNFVEESFSSGDVDTNLFAIHAPGFEDQNKHYLSKQRFQNPSPVSVLESSACSTAKLGSSSSEVSAVPGRARSKRCRTGVCFWNTRILSADASASFLESCSTSTVTVSAPLLHEPEAFAYERAGGADSMPVKKLCKASNQHHQSKLKKAQADHGAASHARRCLHCATQKTPQWRAGPLGPKTLCNACGVRYKSGRLLPEYRPAASPTFVETVHSNSHRRVLEMRKQRTSQPLSSIHEGVARGQVSQHIDDRDVQSNYGDGREDQAEAGAGAGNA